jgi:hypothetical protein
MFKIFSLKILFFLVIPMMYTSTNYYWGEYFSLNIVEEKHEDTTVEKDLKDLFQDFFKNSFEFDFSGSTASDTSSVLVLYDMTGGDDFSLLFFSPPEIV